jgi:hypothetical protein
VDPDPLDFTTRVQLTSAVTVGALATDNIEHSSAAARVADKVIRIEILREG